MKTLIIAVDFSDASEKLIEKGVEIANAFRAKILLVHVMEPQPSYTTYGFAPDEFPAMQSYLKEAQLRAERKLSEMLIQTKNACDLAEAKLLIGNPQHEILDLASKCVDPMVIVGTHGHNLIGSILLGSVAEALVRKAKVPTLVVPVTG